MIKEKLKQCLIGGVLRYNPPDLRGYGFKTVFPSSEEAQLYKEKIRVILEKEGYRIINNGGGYFDKKE